MMVNPTEAKEVALEFLALTGQRPTPQLMGRIIKQVKGLMENGFTTEEIQYTVEHITKMKPDVYSFGYIEACINDVLRKRKKEQEIAKERELKAAVQRQFVEVTPIASQSEVDKDDETSERNRRKAERMGIQPRVREKSYFHLFER